MTEHRRVVAVVLGDLAVELAREQRSAGALAVVLDEGRAPDGEAESGAAVVFAVDDAARARGVRPGMRVAQAMARTAELTIGRVAARAIMAALGTVAEVSLEFGATVEIAPYDTVWIDVTGGVHLFGGETALLAEIESRVLTLGFRARAAIADGPAIARALARFGMDASVPRIAAPFEGAMALSKLPVSALPFAADATAFFARLGVVSIADLMRIERSQLVSRLETFLASARARDPSAPDARQILSWLDGRDDRPLEPYQPPLSLSDEISFEDGVETAGQLVFALRGMVSRLSARLVARRQATSRIELALDYDRTIFRLRSGATTDAPAILAEPRLAIGIDLPAPLSHTEDVFRAVRAKLEALELAAPVVRFQLGLSRIARAPIVQLDLSRDVSVSPDALPALLSELAADIGSEQVGVLVVLDDHRPERRTQLNGANERAPSPRGGSTRKRPPAQSLDLFGPATPGPSELGPPEPVRLLSEPVPLGCSIGGDGRLPAFCPGAQVFVGRTAFVVDTIRFDRRIDGVAWWSSCAASRDYLRVTLIAPLPASTRGPRSGCAADAWVYVDRRSGEVFLQGFWE